MPEAQGLVQVQEESFYNHKVLKYFGFLLGILSVAAYRIHSGENASQKLPAELHWLAKYYWLLAKYYSLSNFKHSLACS